MKISTHIDLSACLAVVQHCRGEVLFCTAEGDKLNLKSTLSTYLFAAMAGNTALLESSSVVCQYPEDEKRLAAAFPFSVEV